MSKHAFKTYTQMNNSRENDRTDRHVQNERQYWNIHETSMRVQNWGDEYKEKKVRQLLPACRNIVHGLFSFSDRLSFTEKRL